MVTMTHSPLLEHFEFLAGITFVRKCHISQILWRDVKGSFSNNVLFLCDLMHCQNFFAVVALCSWLEFVSVSLMLSNILIYLSLASVIISIFLCSFSVAVTELYEKALKVCYELRRKDFFILWTKSVFMSMNIQ